MLPYWHTYPTLRVCEDDQDVRPNISDQHLFPMCGNREAACSENRENHVHPFRGKNNNIGKRR